MTDGQPLPATPRSNQPPSRLQRILRYRLLWVIALTTFLVDQATKLWVVNTIPFTPYNAHFHDDYHARVVIDGFFYLIHVGNPGAAWSILSGQSTFLAFFAFATLIAIFFWRRTLGLHLRMIQISFGLLCGGIVGNLLDRLLHKHVIDFLDFHFGSYTYPTFNLADSGIVIGVILYLWHSFRTPSP